MTKISRTKTFAFALAMTALLAFSGLALAGCGGGGDKATEAEKPASSETSSSSSSNSSSSTKTEEKSTESGPTSLADLESAMSEAYMGVTNADEGFYYAASADGSLSIVMVADKSGNIASFVGAAKTSGDMVTIDDMSSGLSITFQVVPQSDGTILLDMGDLGQAKVAPCEISEVLKVMDTLDTYGTAVN